MEIKVIVKELNDMEAVLESADGETIRLPKRLLPEGKVGAELYVSASAEPGAKARELLNEMIGGHEKI